MTANTDKNTASAAEGKRPGRKPKDGTVIRVRLSDETLSTLTELRWAERHETLEDAAAHAITSYADGKLKK